MKPKISILAIIRLMRPKQWVKNTFVLAPLVFSGTFNSITSVVDALLAFTFFSLASSATYVLNDYNDIESDRRHPVKRFQRPLACGEVTKTQALILMVLLYTSVFMSGFVNFQLLTIIFAYLLLNIAYTFYLKHQPVLDIFTIALGFVFRVYAGAIAIDVPLSSWMFITTLSLALYLAAIKRRQELVKSGDSARNVLKQYSLALIDKYAEMSATCALLFYSLYILSDKPQLVFTIPFVIFGIYRYWFVVESKDEGESPTDALFSDNQLQLTICGWIIACAYTMI
ncbi:decaprenyl-phosphate phosphoribosyltransferase [Vibrio navarrensis]|uniref:Decaprenyl-phosphate phosphoribosyltransferase n=1 Tax=Vibrio navarrensis TaxID=29495 RepID=A0AAJ4LUF3_9VIBR|nr:MULTISPECIES: decaprenyl-phosphate phosphoribosyltransferase [Vibrio]KJR36127.1 phosphoribose diphosphate:decaprenyl-phosphate phosphoribosyltransferase [Vibrio sp. S234-5]MBE3663330.1 decaprenyl-phosphate phosphoribosyltransferase [Vibrio navarrensis]MBE4603469.1 decaprenyl-phosphate phosphoribosyltransferase [Vibrio navarrensis]QPL53796.1 decaprenyl-phosphate phosphoribosyltransferase [Vibrio navarrensis]